MLFSKPFLDILSDILVAALYLYKGSGQVTPQSKSISVEASMSESTILEEIGERSAIEAFPMDKGGRITW
jgi:hypothetical protein